MPQCGVNHSDFKHSLFKLLCFFFFYSEILYLHSVHVKEFSEVFQNQSTPEIRVQEQKKNVWDSVLMRKNRKRDNKGLQTWRVLIYLNLDKTDVLICVVVFKVVEEWSKLI